MIQEFTDNGYRYKLSGPSLKLSKVKLNGVDISHYLSNQSTIGEYDVSKNSGRDVTNANGDMILNVVNTKFRLDLVTRPLTEDELGNYIAAGKPENIDKSIGRLSGNVSTKVAQLMEKEQAKAAKIEQEVEEAKGEPEEELTAEDILAALEQGQITAEDLDAMVQNGEISEEVYNQVVEIVNGQEEQPVEEEMPQEEVPAEGQETAPQGGRSIHIDPDGTTSISMPNGQLALNGDGSMDIQLMESILFNEKVGDSLNREYS